ncbi:hypothetical protein ISCGN_018905 [Ixodes scapularis]
MRDIAAVGRQSPPASVERARSHSDSDERVAMLRARIGRRFEQLEEDRRAALRSSRVTQSSSASSTTTEGPDTPTPLHDLCSPGEPCESLRWGSASRPRSVSVAEVKELAYARLQAELSRAQQELKLKDEEVARLSQIRDEVGAELEELTASLFEADDQTRDSARQKILLIMGEEETGNNGQGRRGRGGSEGTVESDYGALQGGRSWCLHCVREEFSQVL